METLFALLSFAGLVAAWAVLPMRGSADEGTDSSLME